jgi:hypothetical protein
VCGHFKRKPADICNYCGDTPIGGVNYAGGLSDGGDFHDRQKRLQPRAWLRGLSAMVAA